MHPLSASRMVQAVQAISAMKETTNVPEQLTVLPYRVHRGMLLVLSAACAVLLTSD
jgi:hypothetical protein